MKAEDFIRKQVLKILTEAESAAPAAPAPAQSTQAAPPQDAPSTSAGVRRGKIGRGRISKEQIEAGALALEDPQRLLKKLGISGTPAGSGPDKVLNLIKTAIREKTVMSQAYSSARLLKDENGKTYIRIQPAEELSERNAALYILHVLIAAKTLIGDIGMGVVVGTNDAGQAVVEFEKK